MHLDTLMHFDTLMRIDTLMRLDTLIAHRCAGSIGHEDYVTHTQ